MAAKVFKSKVDAWIRILLISVIVVDLVIIMQVALYPESPAATTGIILICVVAMALVLSLLLRTHYTVDKNNLRIVSGPFVRNVAIDQITSVSPTRSPLSSPALSLDRLLIRYGKHRRIIVSPADKQGFLRAIGQEYE